MMAFILFKEASVDIRWSVVAYKEVSILHAWTFSETAADFFRIVPDDLHQQQLFQTT
jgi:hypothetical protein